MVFTLSSSIHTQEMPQVRLNGDKFLLSPDPSTLGASYFIDLASDLDRLRENDKLTNVTIWCNNGRLFAHKFIVESQSKLLSMFFQENPMSSDIICPDFSTETMSALLDLVYSGLAVTTENTNQHQINSAIQSLKFDIQLSCTALAHLGDFQFPGLDDAVVHTDSSANEVTDFSDESLSDVDFNCLQDKSVAKTSTTKSQAFKCPKCSKSFSKKIALNKHRQRSHEANSSATFQEPEEISSLAIQCPVNEELVSSSNLEHYPGDEAPESRTNYFSKYRFASPVFDL